jgi:mannitol-1-phosphate/altronate dehydrogenase
MARKKSEEDITWDKIFSTISYEIDLPAKYIKDAVIKTKTGKRIKLTGKEFASVMEQERMVDPQEAIIESARVRIDFEKIKDDVNKFALSSLKKSGNRYRKNKHQLAAQASFAKKSDDNQQTPV